MGDKDIISKEIFQRLVQDFATYLFHLPVTDVELLDTEHHRIEDRRADLVARVTGIDSQVFLLHIEIQNTKGNLEKPRTSTGSERTVYYQSTGSVRAELVEA